MTIFDHITGADRLTSRFGGWPSFHDAEVVRLVLDRCGANGSSAEMVVHAWSMTDRVDDRGHYVREKHTLVRFVFENIASIELAGFNQQNALLGLAIAADTVEGEPAFRITLAPSYGLGGTLVCGRVAVAEVSPCNECGEAASEA